MSEETPLECLSRLGTNGVLWAQEFNKTAVRLGYSEMDEEWLAGWFANAIENCDVIRCNPLRTENERLRDAYDTDALTISYNLGYTCGKDIAKDEVERLLAENEKLREALKPFAYYALQIPDDISDTCSASGTVGDLRVAAAALKETEAKP